MATSNFSVLSQHDDQLLCQGVLAEKYFADDPNNFFKTAPTDRIAGAIAGDPDGIVHF